MYVPSPRQYLDAQSIQYQLIQHPRSFTARETANAAHLSAESLTKVVVVDAGSHMMMILIPADCVIMPAQLASELGVSHIAIVPEDKLKRLFPQCEVGAMPPFGNLYGMDVCIAKELFHRFEITFNGGSHTELIRMNTVDFCNLTHAQMIEKGYQNKAITIPLQDASLKPWHWI